jgi:hypothetical protein
VSFCGLLYVRKAGRPAIRSISDKAVDSMHRVNDASEHVDGQIRFKHVNPMAILILTTWLNERTFIAINDFSDHYLYSYIGLRRCMLGTHFSFQY